jgi:hypothetical protein
MNKRQYSCLFETLFIVSILEDQDQGNVPIRILSIPKMLEIEGKLLPKRPKILYSPDRPLGCTCRFEFVLSTL